MIIEVKKFKDVNRAPYNPRVELKAGMPEYEKLKKSIETFGHVLPMVFNKRSDNLVGGHQTMTVLEDLGKTEAEMSIVDLSEVEEKALNIGLNKISGEWNNEKLSDILNELIEIPDFDIELTGFNLDEIGEIDLQLPTPETEEDDFDADKAIGEIDEPITKRGDVILLGKHRLMCGDSTDEGDVKKLMDGEKADMVFTDPPYNALKSWNKSETKSETRLNPNEWFENDNMSWEEFDKFLQKAFSNFSGHSVYVCCDYRIYPLIVEKIKAAGYNIKHCIVWKKNAWGLGKRYRFQHEFIVYACKDKAPFTGDRSQSDVWEADVDRATDHKTPKPIKLPATAIRNSSKKGSIALDLFLGSGSTLIAAEQTNRICYGMELSEKYCDVIVHRWEEFTKKKAVRP